MRTALSQSASSPLYAGVRRSRGNIDRYALSLRLTRHVILNRCSKTVALHGGSTGKGMQLTLYRNTDYRLLNLLARASDVVLKARKAELDKYGISPIEALALFSIDDLGNDTTAAELSRKMRRQHNTVMALLRRMEKKKLITMVRDTAKANTWRVGITRKGRTACRKAMSLNSVHQVMARFSDDEKRQLESYLQSICDFSVEQAVSAMRKDMAFHTAKD